MSRLILAALIPAIAATVLGCGSGHPVSTPVNAAPAPHRSNSASGLVQMTAVQAAGEHLSAVPSRILAVDQAFSRAEIGYSYGGCRPAPTAVVIEQSPEVITIILAGPPQPAGPCPSNLAVAKTTLKLPAIHGRTVVAAQSLTAH